ncbi:MAG TPA: MoxR family ATPase, partial [Methanoculleus sp.]|nr:MoxR family ATPase [Methanoculleus sp.]
MKKNNLTERIETIANTYRTIDETTRQMVVGNHHLIRAIFVTMISGGHLLIEGTPGTAKTTISKTIARLINYDFKRIQGAVDIQPADIIG